MPKLSEELLNEIRTVNADANRLISELGITTYRVTQAEAQLEDIRKQQRTCIQELDAVSAKDTALLAKLRSEYGEGMVDMETGEFVQDAPPAQQQ